MAATRRAPRKGSPAGAGKKTSDFYVLRTAQEAVETVADKIETYGKRYVRKPLQAGKAFAADLKKDPRKAVEEALDDGQRLVKEIGRDTRKKVDEAVDGGRKLARDFNRDPRKAVDGLVDDGREWIGEIREETQERVDEMVERGRTLVKGVEKDIRRLVEDLADTSRKLLDKITLREAVEKKVKEQVEALTKQMKLANRKDLSGLSAAVKALTARVEELSRRTPPAVPGEKDPAPKSQE